MRVSASPGILFCCALLAAAAPEQALSSPVGQPVPEVFVTDTSGAQQSTTSLRGFVSIVPVSGAWCAPCRQLSQQLPEVSAAVAQHPLADKVQVVDVLFQGPNFTPATLDDARQWKAYFNHGTVWHANGAPESGAQTLAQFAFAGVSALPKTMIVGPDGKVTHVIDGTDTNKIAQAVVETLNNLVHTAKVAVYVPMQTEDGKKAATEGLRTVVLFSDDRFDARTVDRATIRVSGAPVEKPSVMCREVRANKDVLVDLRCQVATEKMKLAPKQTHFLVTATTRDGMQIRGEASMKIATKSGSE